MRGSTVLQALVELDQQQRFRRRSRDIAELAAGAADGRKVIRTLKRLEQAGLAEYRQFATTRGWYPTARGRDVDAELAARTAARGGTFSPLSESSLTLEEKLAIR